MHFLGEMHRVTYYDQSLRMVAGEALTNIATWSAANCSTILAEPEVIEDLSKMLCKEEYRYVAGNLLQSICAQSGDKLRHLGASVYLSSAVPVVSLFISSWLESLAHVHYCFH